MKFSLVTFYLLVALNAVSQIANNTNRVNKANIYFQSMKHYHEYLKTVSDKTPDTLYINDHYHLIYYLLQDDSLKFIGLNFSNRSDRNILKNKENFVVQVISPLEFDGNEFTVPVTSYTLTFGKNRRTILYTSKKMYCVNFHFENNEFQFVKIEECNN